MRSGRATVRLISWRMTPTPWSAWGNPETHSAAHGVGGVGLVGAAGQKIAGGADGLVDGDGVAGADRCDGLGDVDPDGSAGAVDHRPAGLAEADPAVGLDGYRASPRATYQSWLTVDFKVARYSLEAFCANIIDPSGVYD